MGSRKTWLASDLSYGTCQICFCLRGEDVECLCDDREFDAAMDTLAANLRDVGYAQLAYRRGCNRGAWEALDELDRYAFYDNAEPWEPGCRRPARGEGK